MLAEKKHFKQTFSTFAPTIIQLIHEISPASSITYRVARIMLRFCSRQSRKASNSFKTPPAVQPAQLEIKAVTKVPVQTYNISENNDDLVDVVRGTKQIDRCCP